MKMGFNTAGTYVDNNDEYVKNHLSMRYFEGNKFTSPKQSDSSTKINFYILDFDT